MIAYLAIDYCLTAYLNIVILFAIKSRGVIAMKDIIIDIRKKNNL